MKKKRKKPYIKINNSIYLTKIKSFHFVNLQNYTGSF